MKQTLYSLILTILLGMSGMQAWAQDLSTTEIDGTTYYEIGNAADLVAFASLVNGGEFDANALLTADIDMTGADISVFPIGAPDPIEQRFVGIFDGQGHKLSNFQLINPEAPLGYGMFNTGKGVVLRNFWLDSSCKIEGTTLVGLIGRHDGGTAIFEGVGNCADVTGTNNNIGGFVGGLWAKSDVIETVLIKNCWTAGKVTTTMPELGDGKDCGALAGWFNNATVNIDGFWTIAEVANPKAANQYVFRKGGGATVTYDACFSKYGSQPSFTTIRALDNAMASGELCYKLNEGQTDIRWYQTLPGDPCPLPYEGHDIVYLNGRQHCNGDVYEDTSFANESLGMTKDEHNFAEGFCSYCNLFDETYMTPDEEGFFEISTGGQLAWFAEFVKTGHFESNAKLTGDITFTKPWTTAIGTSDATAFKGVFDGQGHKITGFEATVEATAGGLFGCTNGATIKDFTIEGLLTSKAGTGSGVIGYPSSSKISDIHSYLEINVPVSSVHHVGGVVGSARGGNVIERCSFNGTMTVAAGSTDNFAGVIAYLGGDSVANCVNYGTISFSDAGCAAGGVAGYLNNTTSYVRNCLNVGSVVCTAEGTPVYGGAIIGRIKNNWSSAKVVNNYWLEGSAYGPSRKDDGTSPATASAEGSSESEMASGKIAWLLNEESFVGPVWRQTLNEDLTPQLVGNGAIVYQTIDGDYSCIVADDPSSFAEFLNNVTAIEQAYLEEVVAYALLTDGYKAAVESWQNFETFDAFIEAYVAAMEQKESVEASAAKYAAYVLACDAAGAYLEENTLEGTWADFLLNYLQNEEMPSTSYPNGTYAYIMATLGLDDEAIEKETLFVNQMLENAIAGGVTPGTEITRLLANADFSAATAFEGWTVEGEGGTASVGGTKDIMPIPEGYNNKSFSASQTLTELPNGIYLLDINGLFRAGTDIYAQLYAGQLFLNGTINYFMSTGEDLLSEEEAVVGENCLGEGVDELYMGEDFDGWVPVSRNGCSVAFNAGRYQNLVAAEVTDGTLTVGVRNPGTGLDKDWLPFGDVRLYFLGTADEADEKLAEVLQGYKERAQTIVNFPYSEENYKQYPNMSLELIDGLEQAIAGVDEASDGQAKLELIGTFSKLFQDVYTCRRLYAEMIEVAYQLSDLLGTLIEAGLITDEQYNEWETKVANTQYHFADGDLSIEQAQALVDELNGFDLVLKPVDGVYQLASADDLRLFSVLVASGVTEAKGALTADIDMAELEDFQPIGNKNQAFRGVFDGQGHRIQNFGIQKYEEEGETMTEPVTFTDDRQGLFGYAVGATIKNFSIDGAFNYGVVGWAESNAVIQNVHADLDIASVATSHHIGGICGSLRTGSKVIGCSFSGTLTDSHNSHDCLGGVVGYTNENCSIENSANYGSVTFTASNAYAGGVLGYLNNTAFAGIKNCLNTGTVKRAEGESQYGGAIGGRIRSNTASTFQNNYWLEGSAERVSGENAIQGETANVTQLASGEVCFKLNGDQTAISWYQTINEDDFPVLFPDHEQVFFNAEEGYYYNLVNGNPVGIGEVVTSEAESIGGIYNLAGQRLSRMQKGINIVNGKKVLVK